MSNNYKILPSILSADSGRIIEESQTVDIPEIEYLHVDIMDGHFVPNLTMGPQIVQSLKKHTRFKLDVHLMITNAEDMIPQFADAGADILTIHQEAVTHLHRQIHRIKEYGISAGVTINPATPLDSIRWILPDVDLVLIMSVNPGFGGQSFIPVSLERISLLNRLKQELNTDFILEVDGGINPETAGAVYSSGGRYFVAGSAIFGQKDRPHAIHEIMRAIEDEQQKKSSVRV